MRKTVGLLALFSLLHCVCGPLAWGSVSKEEAVRLFVKGEIAYKAAKYPNAVELYEQIVSGGWESGAVYYNLGNAYFRIGNLGKAILNYERASRLIPRDSDLRANFTFARGTVGGLNTSLPLNWPQRIAAYSLRILIINEILLLIVAALVLCAASHMLMLYVPAVRKPSRFMLAFGLICLVLLIADYALCSHSARRLAVALSPTVARFEPRAEATTHFEIFEGQKVRVTKREGEWFKIQRFDDKMGWIERDKVELITLDRRM